MRIAHLEFWSGLAGDMFVGALLDAGWPEERLREVVSALDLGSVEIEVERRTHRGLSGVGIRVRAAKDPHARHLEEILKLIDAARIPARAKETATRAFRLLGEAEAKIHGIPIERVHFHEVGAADSIVDFVATATALADLEIERVTAGAIPLTTGWVEMDHGRLPVPAPATALLLEGWPVHSVPVEGEFFTPTAAALLRAVAIPLEVTPNMQVERVGYGAGTRPHPQLPNLVRLWLGQATEEMVESDVVFVLETQVDDMEPRQLALLSEDLMAQGALDVLRTPVGMKKGRLGTAITVIATPKDADRLALRLLDRSTSIGVRMRREQRRTLRRKIETIETEFGPARVKWAEAPSGPRVVPEYEDVRRIAVECDLPFAQVEERIRRAAVEIVGRKSAS